MIALVLEVVSAADHLRIHASAEPTAELEWQTASGLLLKDAWPCKAPQGLHVSDAGQGCTSVRLQDPIHSKSAAPHHGGNACKEAVHVEVDDCMLCWTLLALHVRQTTS